MQQHLLNVSYISLSLPFLSPPDAPHMFKHSYLLLPRCAGWWLPLGHKLEGRVADCFLLLCNTSLNTKQRQVVCRVQILWRIDEKVRVPTKDCCKRIITSAVVKWRYYWINVNKARKMEFPEIQMTACPEYWGAGRETFRSWKHTLSSEAF